MSAEAARPCSVPGCGRRAVGCDAFLPDPGTPLAALAARLFPHMRRPVIITFACGEHFQQLRDDLTWWEDNVIFACQSLPSAGEQAVAS